MKTYLIKQTDILHQGKIFPEGSTINLDDKDAQSLSDYLVTLSEVEVSSINNKEQKTNNKRSNK